MNRAVDLTHQAPYAAARQRHVLVITSTFPRWPNDTEPPFVFELCKKLSQGYEVTVLAPHAPGANQFEMMGAVRVLRFRYAPQRWETLTYLGGIIANLKEKPWRYALLPFFFLSQWAALRKIVRSEKIDLIHAHWLVPQGFTAALVGCTVTNAPPLVCTSHGGDLLSLNSGFMNQVKRWVIRRSSFVTVVNEAMKPRALALGADPEKLETLSMGVDGAGLFTKACEVTRSDKEILFVGRLVDKKGLAHLIEAMPEILSQVPGVRLTVVGDGPNASALKRRSTELGIAGAILFLGARTNAELPPLYSRATLLVAPSVITDQGDQEGMPVVLLEALACECPVVTTDLPAMQELLTHRQSALIVSQRNPSQIAAAVVELLEAPTLRSQLAREGKELALRKFDWTHVAMRHATIFEQLMR